MGGGRWDAGAYEAYTGARIRSGKQFEFSGRMRTRPRTKWRAHPELDPVRLKAGRHSPFAGQNIREARDSDEHPNSTPIAVFFDETGSMGSVPRLLQERLADLFGLLVERAYAQDPQIMIGAYGDAEVDMVPLQASQFESDNRIDVALDQLFLEGNGGGNGFETAALAWYFAATHTATDAWDKRGKKGYLFTIGDETTGGLTRGQVREFTGDRVRRALTADQIAELADERWHVFHLLVDTFAARHQGSLRHYTQLLGRDAVVPLEDPGTAAETIAGIIGVMEGRVDTDRFAADLADVGTSRQRAQAALAAVSGTARLAALEPPAAGLR